MQVHVAKFAVSLLAGLTLLPSGPAFGAEAGETQSVQSETTAPQAPSESAEFVLTENRRETNLKKSASGIMVLGVESQRRHTAAR